MALPEVLITKRQDKVFIISYTDIIKFKMPASIQLFRCHMGLGL